MRSFSRRKSAAVILLSLFANGAPAVADDAVVFMYHRFGETEFPSTNIRLDQFDAHLEYLDTSGYTVRPLDWIIDRLNAGEPVPDRTVAITIDDAYLSIYREAWPRLAARGWPFTVFVATDPVDQGLAAYLDWDQIREMHEAGVSFANHSASHDHLVQRRPGETAAGWRERVTSDIEQARQRLLDELGETPSLFAYPFGEYNRELADIVREQGFEAAFGQHSGAIAPTSDRRALPRYPMAEAYADLDEFRIKAASRALPVIEIHPWDPVVSDARRAPRLTFRLAESDARLEQLACYASHTGSIEVNPVEGQPRTFSTRAPLPLPPGRSRYNCTAPAAEPDRYFWFSQPWLRLPAE